MTPPATNRGAGRTVAAWCLYDWANSSFTTLVVTFVYATYFTKEMASDINEGTRLWSWGVAVSAIFIALLSPFLGAYADRGGTRRLFLMVSTLVCVCFTALLAFIKPSAPNAAYLALAAFIIANIGFETGLVFYNAFLPVIAATNKIGRLSGYGWSLGYAGGISCLLVALFALAKETPVLGIPTDQGFQYRATNLLVALWFLLFSIPMFIYAPREKRNRTVALRAALSDLLETFAKIRRYRQTVRFLLAHLIYNDGLVTIFAFGGIYAAGTFGMSYREVIVFGVALNIAAGLGAFLFGFVDDRIGGKRTILFSICALFVATVLAVAAPGKVMFWMAAIVIGIFAGPNQSASRSLMGRCTPEKHRAEFFGFYATSGKITSFLGPFLLGAVTAGFKSQRAGVATILIFFVIGGLLLAGVNEEEGIAAGNAGRQK